MTFSLNNKLRLGVTFSLVIDTHIWGTFIAYGKYAIILAIYENERKETPWM